MKATKIIGAVFLAGFFTVGNVLAQSNDAMKKSAAKKETKMNKAMMNNTYLVIAPHTTEQCMKLIEEMSTKGYAYLSKFKFGCKSGDHTSYAFLTGASEDDVRKMLPDEVQASAKIEKIDTFTPQQIADMHKGM
jgi:hypothetical protein